MRFAKTHSPSQEDTRKVKAQTTAQTVEVRADGEGLVSHAGSYLLVELADRLRPTPAVAQAIAPTREGRARHHPGGLIRDRPIPGAHRGDCGPGLCLPRRQE